MRTREAAPQQLRLWGPPWRPEATGTLIAGLRRRSGRTQRDLAAAAGLTQSRISRIETGLADPGLDDVVSIATVLGVTVGSLLGSSGVVMRRHLGDGDRDPARRTSINLAEALSGPAMIRAFVERGGSPRALAAARAGRQPLSTAQAAIAYAVLLDGP